MSQLSTRRISILAAIPVIVVSIMGCDTKVERSSPPVSKAKTAPQSETVVQGGGAGLGKVRNSTDRLKTQVDDHNRNIDKQIEDLNKK